MSSLSKVEARLPPGFRFHPKDEELICDYLIKWMSSCSHPFPELIQVDLNKCEPWDIPGSACVGGKEWYFYSHKDRKYATGHRTNRATVSGYWKATGKDRPIDRKGTLVGMRKTLVFYQGRAPKGRKTDWVMHEFRVHGPGPKVAPPIKGDWVLCRVFFKSRAEIPVTQEPVGKGHDGTASSPSPSPSLPALMEPPPPYISFEQSEEACATDPYRYNQQVPCFSIFSHMDSPHILPDPSPNNHLGVYSSSSCCDRKTTIKAVLNHLTKMETTQPNNLMTMMMMMKGSSPAGLGEGSSDWSYLSHVGGLPSVWNQYS